MKHIILIGFMGCGKSRVGRQLAQELQLPFEDMDAQIVKEAKMPITKIFEEYGEEYFRKLESKVLRELLMAKERTVISSGGGMPIQERNHMDMKERAMVVYLNVPTKVLMKRLRGDKTRPILQGGNLHEKITTLRAKRDPIYEKVSDITIKTGDKSVDEVIAQIKERLC